MEVLRTDNAGNKLVIYADGKAGIKNRQGKLVSVKEGQKWCRRNKILCSIKQNKLYLT
jgi:hypothetical protein